MKNPFRIKRNGDAVAKQTNGHGEGNGQVNRGPSRSPAVESQPISPNTLGKAPRIRGAVGVPSVCPYCAVGCGQMVYIKGGKIIDIEGNYNSPINEGTLCPKGANTFQLTVNPHRVKNVLYRAPFSDHWEERPLEWAMDRIAERIKETRDRDFVEKKDGKTVNNLSTIMSLGGATMDNEENYLIKKLFTGGLGIVALENQARI
jgi:formate dehydrogenase major subunit